MTSAVGVALFLGVLTAVIGRLRAPYVSAVWCALMASSVGVWVIAFEIQPTFMRSLGSGLALHFTFALAFVLTAFALEHALEAVTRRHLN